MCTAAHCKACCDLIYVGAPIASVLVCQLIPWNHLKYAWRSTAGPWTPESVGDYASGTNHVLPTYGYARMYSGVSLDSFQKKMTVQVRRCSGTCYLMA